MFYFRQLEVLFDKTFFISYSNHAAQESQRVQEVSGEIWF